MKKLLWSLTFVFGAPALIIWSFVLLAWLSPSALPHPTPAPQVLSLATDVPPVPPEISARIISGDARVLILKKYLSKYGSALEPYARHLVETSDKYSLDYRLLVAIAQQESNLCEKIPPGSHNCWGYGIYGDNVVRFENFPQAINIVARSLKNDYINKGLDTPQKIMAKYTPPSVHIGGPWAASVSQFLSELE